MPKTIIIITNKVIRQKSRYANRMANKSLFVKKESKSEWYNIMTKLLVY